MVAPLARLASLGTASAVLVLLLAGCAAEQPAAPATPEPSAPVVEPTPEPTTAAPAGPTIPPAIPFEIACDDLVTPEAIYAFNPNYALLPEPVIAAGTLEERIRAELGTVCSWQHLSSSEILSVSVAELPAETLVKVQNDAFETSNMVPTYGVEGYFTVRDGVGEAIAFDGSYWVTTTSPAYLEPGDAVDILTAALSALP
jgi:hypothetical protein